MTQLQEKECLKGRFVHLHLHTLYSALDGAIKIILNCIKGYNFILQKICKMIYLLQQERNLWQI